MLNRLPHALDQRGQQDQPAQYGDRHSHDHAGLAGRQPDQQPANERQPDRRAEDDDAVAHDVSVAGPPAYVILQQWPVEGVAAFLAAILMAHDLVVEDSDDFGWIDRIASSTAGPITQITLAKADRPGQTACYRLELS